MSKRYGREKFHIVWAVICFCFAFILASCASQEASLQEESPAEQAGAATQQTGAAAEEEEAASQEQVFSIPIRMEGGSGKAVILSPVTVVKKGDELQARFVWSSKNYDYMIVNGQRYDNENEGGNSSFTVAIENTEEPLTVIGDTLAMSKPHEIEYTIYWDEAAAVQETAVPGTGGALAVSQQPAGVMELHYATQFAVTEYEGFYHIHIENSGEYILPKAGGSVPEELAGEAVILPSVPERVYLVSSSVMDLLRECNALEQVRLTGTRAGDWYVDGVAERMEAGEILYAGKYSAPDYELVLAEGCDLAIENTMIYHEPEVKEKLEELGIPVLVETSSYEGHPLGRLEWIRLYGLLFGRQAEADAYFEEQLQRIEPVMEKENTGMSVAFFHVTANGLINVRKPADYIAKMIDLSGGSYVLQDVLTEGNALSTMNMQMEDFYAAAREADILIYNSTIAGEIASVEELLEKNALFADFKAVKEGRVYCTDKDFFQQTTGMAEFMQDLYGIYTAADSDCTYLKRLE